ncbi:hypothetical protein ABID16_004193 [Rhizobium aquaticum]|uniref:Transposase n=1 Tax=Rhizobium aquaticum TaxID=1549636 RepID=A0ABV2J522_9HYPH
MPAPVGARFKGYKDCFVREPVVKAELVRDRRECWVSADGKTIIASLPQGVSGGYGPNVRRFCLMLHARAQVTTQRLATLLNDVGIEISKRQVVRMLTSGLDGFVAEDAAILHVGLVLSSYVTVYDTGARHGAGDFHTTQIGGEHFSAFRTTPSKTRLNFLWILRGHYCDYALNQAALDYLQERHGVDSAVIARLRTRRPLHFAKQVPFLEHLAARGIDIFNKQIVRLLAEAAIFGAIRHRHQICAGSSPSSNVPQVSRGCRILSH